MDTIIENKPPITTLQNAADFFIQYYNDGEEEPYISNLMLNKLLFFAQGFCLARLNRPLFEQDFESWKCGPVIPQLYFQYKQYGSASIPPNSKKFHETKVFDDETLDVLAAVINEYYDYTPSNLLKLTQEVGTPWYQAIKNYGNEKHVLITKIDMCNYFQDKKLKNDNLHELLENMPRGNGLTKEEYEDEEDNQYWESFFAQLCSTKN